MEIDLEHAQRYLDILGPDEEFTFQTFSDRDELKERYIDQKSGREKKRDPNAKVLHGTLATHRAALVDLNGRGAGVFVMLNRGDGLRHEGEKTCRTNANVIGIRGLFLDLDDAPLDPVLSLPSPPSVVVQTSPKRWHAVWLLDPPPPLESFSKSQAELAKRFGGDPSVTDLARVIRLPGFMHQKADPFQSRIVDLQQMMGNGSVH
jgi:hypothetical protein